MPFSELYQAHFCLKGTPETNLPTLTGVGSPLEYSRTDYLRLRGGKEPSEMQYLPFSVRELHNLSWELMVKAWEAERTLGMKAGTKLVDNYHALVNDKEAFKRFFEHLKGNDIGFFFMVAELETGEGRIDGIVLGHHKGTYIFDKDFNLPRILGIETPPLF